MNRRRLVIWSIIATGISSVTTQLLTIREFLSQFQGNEITISLVLFSWLLLTGLGSLAAKFVKRPSWGVYALLALIVGVWPLVQMLVIRGFREVIFAHGTSPGFYPMFGYILATLTPYCLLSGFILPYAQKVLHDQGAGFTSGDLYLTDNLGDITGGALFSFVLVYWLKPFPILAVTSTFLILAALLIHLTSRSISWFFVGLCLASLFYYGSLNSLLEMRSLSAQYGQIVRYLESPYGRIVISREGPQYTLWESGVPMYSEANIVRSEEKVHYPLCQLTQVRNVLLVSGGLGETFAEIAKYDPQRVDYVELDPYLTGAALDLGILKKTPHLVIMNMDGRRYVKRSERKYDAVIVDLPDPDTFQINRFFTSEFFSLTKKILVKEGIFSISMEYSSNYISDIRLKKLSTLFNTLRLHFQNVMVLPGEEAYFLCSDGPLSAHIPARLKEKGIETAYIEGYFNGNVTEERIGQLKAVLDSKEAVNTDFKPRLMNIVFEEWFMKYGSSPKYFLMGLAVLAVVYVLGLRREEYVLFSTGLATMGAEMLMVFTFQIIYGYVYLQIGAIVTIFLLGLLPGAVLGKSAKEKHLYKLLFSDMFILFLIFLFYVGTSYYEEIISTFYFLLYSFIFGFLCGFQFPLSASIIGESNHPAAGCLAADLIGASLGTLVIGAILIPLWGIEAAVVFLILVKGSSSVMMMLPGKGRARLWAN